MSVNEPKFSSGDSVRERFPSVSAAGEIGIVTQRYEFEGEYRYVVKFKSGREDVFYERELIPVTVEARRHVPSDS
jgi:hypothetical protein